MSERWKIDQLADLVATALGSADYGGQSSRRVKGVPDKRTIRYYTTIGLLDRPAEIRGRTAYYGRRHALQLVAIKRLQARGLSLLEVQQSLAGKDERGLQKLADLPDEIEARLADASTSGEAQPADRGEIDGESAKRGRFWASIAEVPQAIELKGPSEPAPTPVDESPWLPRAALYLPLSEGVELVIEGIESGRLTQGESARLRLAAENLIQAIGELGLASGPSGPSPESGSSNTSSENQDK